MMEDEAPKTKPKRQLTEAQLAQLAKAREKANAVRKRNAEMKRKEKKLKELQRQVQEEELNEELNRYESPAPAAKQAEAVSEEEEDEPEPEPPPKPDRITRRRDKPGSRSIRSTAGADRKGGNRPGSINRPGSSLEDGEKEVAVELAVKPTVFGLGASGARWVGRCARVQSPFALIIGPFWAIWCHLFA